MEHTFDIIFDTAGKEKLSRISSLLTETGVYITTAARMDVMVKSWRRRSKGTKFIFDISKSSRASLASLMYLVERGAYRPTVDRVFPLEDGAAAHQYYETHRKRGAVVLQMK